MEKRILILTAGFGEGHNAAARGMRDGLAAVAGDAAVVELHDLFAETYGFANDWVRKGYLAMINRAPRAWAASSTTGPIGSRTTPPTCACFSRRRAG